MDNSLRILFVEDSEADTQIVLQELRQGGYIPIHQRVDSAVMLQLALQQYTWDIVICDYLLPGFGAPQALQILKTTRLDLPCIVLSGMIGEDAAVEMMRAGASDYLFKGQLKRLLPAIDRELREANVRQAKRQADASILQLAAIVESTEDAIVSTDLKGRVLTWNPGAEKLYGYTVLEAQGQLLLSLIQPNSDLLLPIPSEQPGTYHTNPANQINSQINKVIDCRQVTQRRKTGELIEVSLTVSLIRGLDGKVVGFAIIARDISERQIIQRMKDEFISVVNHELRTPLASLQGSIELLLTGKLGELSERGLRMLQIAAGNIDRLVDLTSNILTLEDLTSGNAALVKQPCDIGEVVNHAVSQEQPRALKRGIQLLVVPQSIQITLDRERMIQVFHHLVANAIQFSPTDSKIWIEVKLQEGKTPIDSPHVLISVKDQGQGIPPEQLDKIFEQFQQGDASDTRRPGGVGLGLTICQNIVQQHQGCLWVESSIGQGSTFYLTLPVQRVAVQA